MYWQPTMNGAERVNTGKARARTVGPESGSPKAVSSFRIRAFGKWSTLLLAALFAMPATTFAFQTVAESHAPREPDLVLADDPLLRIGMFDGPPEYLFGEVKGAIRLEDGSVVVADEQSYEVRMYDATGIHLWTNGQEGEGPGEYKGLTLLRDCPGAPITVFDWALDRITELGPDGTVANVWSVGALGVQPYGNPACTPGGELVFAPWPETLPLLENLAVGEHFRWTMSLNWQHGDSIVVLRSEIPGTDRTFYGRGTSPRIWGRTPVFAVASGGVWFGSADDYELQQVDWTGSLRRIARWSGPNLNVTRGHVRRYQEARLAEYASPERRQSFEQDRWPDIQQGLPERFPAYEGLLSLADGSLWVTTHEWRAPDQELHVLDSDGTWIRRLTIPTGAVLMDAGPDWVLLLQHDEFDAPFVAVYPLTASGASTSSSG